MTKKSFKDSNPALQFISTTEQQEEGEGNVLAYNTHNADNTFNTPQTPHTKFKEEIKSKRLNLLLQPSVVADMEKIAAMKRSSVNDLISTVLKNFISLESDTLTKYEEVFGN